MHTDDGETANRQPVILFADDDQLCLDVGVRMLQKLGFTVLEAKDGQEAIEVYKTNQNKVDLVIVDMKMPNNGGLTFDQLRKINADVKILITTGYTEDYRIREIVLNPCRWIPVRVVHGRHLSGLDPIFNQGYAFIHRK